MSAKVGTRPIGKEKLLNIMAGRTFAYSLLRRLFLEEPSRDFVQLLADEELVKAFPATGDARVSEGVEALGFSLRDPDILSEAGIDGLQTEFQRLFVTLGSHELISPYESFYRNPDRLVFQKQTLDVRAEYAKHDLRPERLQQEPDDHIALELEFMQRLSEKCLDEIRGNRYHKARRLLRAQKRFLEDHLLKWAPELAERLLDKSETDFFTGAAKILSGYLKADADVLEALINDITERLKRHKEKAQMKSVK